MSQFGNVCIVTVIILHCDVYRCQHSCNQIGLYIVMQQYAIIIALLHFVKSLQSVCVCVCIPTGCDYTCVKMLRKRVARSAVFLCLMLLLVAVQGTCTMINNNIDI